MHKLLIILLLLCSSVSLSAQALNEKWEAAPLRRSETVDITLYYKPVMDVNVEKWLMLEIHNKTAHDISVRDISLSLTFYSTTLMNGNTYVGWSDIDFRYVDLFLIGPSQSNKYHEKIGPKEKLVIWERICDDMTAAFISNGFDRDLKVFDSTDYKIGIVPRLNNEPTKDTIFILRKGLPKARYPDLARRLESCLNKEYNYLEYSNLLRALLQKPIVDIVGDSAVITAFLSPKLNDSFKRQVLARYLSEFCSDPSTLDQKIIEHIQKGLTLQVSEVIREYWKAAFLVPLIKLFEQETVWTTQIWFHLHRNTSDWTNKPALRHRIVKHFIAVNPYINLTPDSLNTENMYFWAETMSNLISTGDSLAIPKILPFLNIKTAVHSYRAWDFSNYPDFLPPNRICDIVLDGYYAITGRNLLQAFLNLSGRKSIFWTNNNVHDPCSFLDPQYISDLRDTLIQQLQQELKNARK